MRNYVQFLYTDFYLVFWIFVKYFHHLVFRTEDVIRNWICFCLEMKRWGDMQWLVPFGRSLSLCLSSFYFKWEQIHFPKRCVLLRVADDRKRQDTQNVKYSMLSVKPTITGCVSILHNPLILINYRLFQIQSH
jgi:hypothetical protein